jgi:predicted RecA/RadA family phage recombinase
MQNFKQPGNVVKILAAPAGGAETGEGYIIEDLFVVATGGGVEAGASVVPAGEDFEGLTVGVVALTKTAAQVWGQGETVSWDDTAKEATNLSADRVIGVAHLPAAGADATGEVRLNGTGNPASTIMLAEYRPFVSTEQTGTGAPQNIAHGLGVIPAAVVIVPTDTAPATAGDYTATEGAHDATNVVVTVTLDKKFKAIAWR